MWKRDDVRCKENVWDRETSNLFYLIIFAFLLTEDRLKEIQKSRNNLQPHQHQHSSEQSDNDDVMMQLRNAAGLRKPMTLLYNCISCDRPVDISLRGVMGSIPRNFPAKKSMGPYTSYDLDNVSDVTFSNQTVM